MQEIGQHTSAPDASALRPTAGQEWRANWLLVLSAMAGLSFGAIPAATLGLFMGPLQNDFGWSRAQISAGMAIFAVVSLPLTPFAGALVDRFGPRRVAVPGIALAGMTFAGFSLLGDMIAYWFAGWIAYSLASLLIRTLVWNSAISSAFLVSRGLALAVLLSGMGVATALAPIATHWLIDGFGWRNAYIGIGLGWGGVAFVLIALFFHDSRSRRPASLSASSATHPAMLPGGLTLVEALRSTRMLRIGLAIFLQSLLGAAIVVHMVPLLTSTGISRGEAAGIAAMLGIGSISGKLITGWLSDRSRNTLLPVSSFALPALGYFLLMEAGGSPAIASLAVFLLGYGSGASLHMATYLTTQYAGLRHFGKIFGMISSLMALAGGIGPLAAGLIFDETGSYTGLLLFSIPAALAAGAAVFRLGPYVEFAPVAVPEEKPAAAGQAQPA